MEWLSLLVVSPLELLYRGLFEVVQIFVKNLGLALIALSFVTVTLMIPLERCVKSVVAREKLIEKVLEPQIKAIKGKFHGAEQNEALRRLYKRYRYNPILSVRSAFGVLIQLPFLMGAYWMLSDYEALKGVSFGLIRDLSLPDGLLWGINLLPLLMTAINLATIVVSRLEKRDAIQALFIAVLFLVLLYTAPSALLLYWTMNNVLHFVRAGLKRIPFNGAAFKAICEHISSFAKRYSKLIVFSLLLGVFLFANKRAFQFSYSEAKTLFWIALLWDALLVGVLWFFFKNKLRGSLFKSVRSLALAIASVVFGVLFAALFFHLIEKAWNPERRAQLEFLFVFLIPLSGFIYLCLSSRMGPFLKRLELEKKAVIEAGFVAGILLLFLGVVWFPLLTYASDPSFFSGFSPRVLASSRISLFIACTLCFAFLWIIASKVRVAFSLFLLFLGISSLTFAFVVTPDYGVIDTFFLQYESALSTNLNRITDVFVYLATPLALIALVWFGKVRILRNIFAIGLVVAVFACRQEVVSAENLLSGKASLALTQSGTEEDTVPEYVKEFHTFSKTGKNVVVIFLDMFTGGNMKEILQSEPSLRKSLDGFTWYKDVVTAGSLTIYGKAAVLGGESAAAWILNKDREHTLEEKINRSWAEFFNQLIDDKFRIRVSEDVWLRPDLINEYVKDSQKQIFASSPLWAGTANYWVKQERLNVHTKDVNYTRFWVAIGLFNVAPLSQRTRIYDGATWMKAVDTGDSSTRHARRWLAELDTHKDFSSVTEKDKDNRFLFVSSLITHVPWALDEACLPCKNGGWNESRDLANGGLSQEHLRAERCSLLSVVRWLNWMKENNVYDNTQVIVVSDHGRYDSSELVAINGGQFYPLALHGLLLIKNFDEHGELRIDDTHRMANSDVPEIVLRNVQGRDCSDAPWMNPERVRYHARGPWMRSKHPDNYFSNATKWRIGGSVYDIREWKNEGALP